MALTAEQALTQAQMMYTQLGTRRPEIDEFERYYDGKQPLTFASKEWANVHQNRYTGFSDNWCSVVGSAPAERTQLDGFRLGLDTDAVSDDERALWRDWEINDGPAQSAQGFETGTVAKRSFALVWGNRDGEPTLSWEHPAQVYVAYDGEDRRVRTAAIKAWDDGDMEYLTLYTPDEVWKWSRPSYSRQSGTGQTESGLYISSSTFAGSGGWIPRQGPSDDTWPIRNPLGRVPIVEYPNRPRLGHGPQSDIKGTMAMQDAVNLMWAYLFVAADLMSMPARVVLGQQPPKMPILDTEGNETGRFQPLDQEALKAGRMLWLSGDNSKIDQWDASPLDVFTGVITTQVQHIAMQTKTPLYLLNAEIGNIDADTLTAHDAPLVAKVGKAQQHYTASVRETFALMALVRDNIGVAEAARSGNAQWHNAALASDMQITSAAKAAREAGMPMQSVLEDVYGYEPEHVERVMDMIDKASRDPYLAALDNKE